jgi:hypothetical protein
MRPGSPAHGSRPSLRTPHACAAPGADDPEHHRLVAGIGVAFVAVRLRDLQALGLVRATPVAERPASGTCPDRTGGCDGEGRPFREPGVDLGDRTKLTQTMCFATTEERDTTMQYGIEEGAKGGFARVDELLQRLPLEA